MDNSENKEALLLVLAIKEKIDEWFAEHILGYRWYVGEEYETDSPTPSRTWRYLSNYHDERLFSKDFISNCGHKLANKSLPIDNSASDFPRLSNLHVSMDDRK